jgi:hypothetical protein
MSRPPQNESLAEEVRALPRCAIVAHKNGDSAKIAKKQTKAAAAGQPRARLSRLVRERIFP